jgi:hypothetical protein
LNHYIQNVRFLNALIADGTAIQKVFAFVKRNASNMYETIQLTVRIWRYPRTSNVLCEDNHNADYNDIVYKDLQKNFFPTLRRKMVALESQPQTELASIQTRLVQPGRS